MNSLTICSRCNKEIYSAEAPLCCPRCKMKFRRKKILGQEILEIIELGTNYIDYEKHKTSEQLERKGLHEFCDQNNLRFTRDLNCEEEWDRLYFHKKTSSDEIPLSVDEINAIREEYKTYSAERKYDNRAIDRHPFKGVLENVAEFKEQKYLLTLTYSSAFKEFNATFSIRDYRTTILKNDALFEYNFQLRNNREIDDLKNIATLEHCLQYFIDAKNRVGELLDIQ
ncbi:hypothetical protein IW492_02830 [Enterococcus sp. BWB1-3]|uniref:hypothetical protein n=1 Tax=Enterococcus sp. BWB1-3 TaxID=2787713 RepID=UPI0019211959|nr:hypothetical protein [Enterococcus sp. BWB1-3]MBL1228166.1 hypothetical protein [Enterococcus sp. BWB1-3]